MAVYERRTLPNGLRVLTSPMPQAQSVTVMIMLAAGSRYETEDTNGIAHFAEHMFFKGTERRPRRATSPARSTRSAASSTPSPARSTPASTSSARPSTPCRARRARRHARHSKFQPDEIEREKGVIVEEMNMYFDTPRDYIGGVYEALLFGDQPLGWDIVGRKETVRAATRETFFGYLDRWYRPERMVVGLGGRLDGDVLASVEKLLGDLAAQNGGAAGPAPASPMSGRVKVHSKTSDQAHLCLGVPSFPLTHPDRYTLQLLSTVLGGGMSSRLFTEVRERRGLAYYVFGLNHSYTDTGSLYAQAGVDINRIDEAVTTIVNELKRIAEERVPADELEKARNFAKGRFVLQLESPQGTIMFGLRREVLEGRAIEPQEVLDGLDAVTADEIQRVAQQLIADEALRLP
jgi:predicted Zn-dependent peptidase